MLHRDYSHHDGLRPDAAPNANLPSSPGRPTRRPASPRCSAKDNADGLTRFLRHGAIPTVPGGYAAQFLLEA